MKYGNRFISLLSDYGFKAVFADQTDTRFLKKAIQALIQSENTIERLEFARNEFIGDTVDSRNGLYDLFCIDEKGNSYIVEMQLAYHRYHIHRAKYYASQ